MPKTKIASDFVAVPLKNYVDNRGALKSSAVSIAAGLVIESAMRTASAVQSGSRLGGVPELDPPSASDKDVSYNNDSYVSDVALAQTVNESRALEMKSGMMQLEIAKQSQKEKTEEIEKQAEKRRKLQEEMKKLTAEGGSMDLWTKVFAGIGSAAMLVGAACAVAATGGAATPLLLVAIAVVIQTSGSYISVACGGPELSISKGLIKVSELFLVECGVSAEEAKRLAPIIAGAVAVLVPVLFLVSPELMGEMAKAIALEAGASEKAAMYIGIVLTVLTAVVSAVVLGCASGGAGTLSSIAVTLQGVAQITGAVSQATAAGLSAGKKAGDIVIAEKQCEVAMVEAMIEKLRAPSDMLRKASDDLLEEFEMLFKHSRDFYQRSAEMRQVEHETTLFSYAA